MKRYITLLISALLLFASCTPGKVEFTPDTGTVLRNPLNGWVMYLRRDWDEKYGDRMNKIVFIGQHLDKAAITELMDGCLADQDLS